MEFNFWTKLFYYLFSVADNYCVVYCYVLRMRGDDEVIWETGGSTPNVGHGRNPSTTPRQVQLQKPRVLF